MPTRAPRRPPTRFALIADYYAARKTANETDPAHADYRPLKPNRLYLEADEWRERPTAGPLARLTPFESASDAQALDCGGRVGRDFAPERQDENVNVFEAAAAHVRRRCASGGSGHRRGMERWIARAAEPRPRRARPEADRARLLLGAGAAGARGRAAARGDRARAWLRVRRSRHHRRAGHSGRSAGAAGPAETARAGCARRGLGAVCGRFPWCTSTTASAVSSA